MADLLTLTQVIQRRWWLIILPPIVALLLLLPNISSVLNPATSYQVAMRFTAAPPSDVALDATATYEDSVYVPWLASEYVVVNLVQWITSDTFMMEVSTVLVAEGLDISPEDLQAGFVADAARSILVVFITWDDAAEVQAIAEAAIDVLQNRNQTYFPQFAATPADVRPLDTVDVQALAPGFMTRFSPFLRLIIALGAGVALAAIVEFLDTTIHTRRDLQDATLEVYGIIPAK